MKFKRLLNLALAFIFIISQSAMAINKEFVSNNDISSNIEHYTKYFNAVNPQDFVTIPDPQLKALINKTLDISRSETKDITKAEMESLTTLSNTLNNIRYLVSDLTGLEYAVNLVTLSIIGDPQNKLSFKNVDAIQHLTKLVSLTIKYSDLKMIDITKNINLSALDISHNNLLKINLSKNVNLNTLILENNSLSNINLINTHFINDLRVGNQNIQADLEDVTIRDDKIIVKNKLMWNGSPVREISGNGVSYDYNNNIVTINNPSKAKSVSYTFKQILGFSGTVTINLSVTEVSLSSTDSKINVGDKKQLTEIVIPNKALDKSVTWSSSDKNVATVDQNGLVTAVGVGTATITVTTNDGGYKATSTITVNPIKVSDIVLSSTNSTIEIGETEQLTETVTPDNATDKSVTWSSSDKNVAIVDQNGLVTAVGVGTATITVTTNDGGHKAISTITVTPIKVTNIVLTSTNSTIKIGETEQLNVTIIPDNAMDKSVTWSSSDESVAKVDQNGLVTAVGVGTATITVTTNDGGFTSSSIITVNSNNQGSVNELDNNQNNNFINNSNNNINNNQSDNNSGLNNIENPQTGVAGLSDILGIAGFVLCSAFASRKRKK